MLGLMTKYENMTLLASMRIDGGEALPTDSGPSVPPVDGAASSLCRFGRAVGLVKRSQWRSEGAFVAIAESFIRW